MTPDYHPIHLSDSALPRMLCLFSSTRMLWSHPNRSRYKMIPTRCLHTIWTNSHRCVQLEVIRHNSPQHMMRFLSIHLEYMSLLGSRQCTYHRKQYHMRISMSCLNSSRKMPYDSRTRFRSVDSGTNPLHMSAEALSTHQRNRLQDRWLDDNPDRNSHYMSRSKLYSHSHFRYNLQSRVRCCKDRERRSDSPYSRMSPHLHMWRNHLRRSSRLMLRMFRCSKSQLRESCRSSTCVRALVSAFS